MVRGASGEVLEPLQRKSGSSGSGFLTKAQQDILDAAILEKQKSSHLAQANGHCEQSTPRLGKAPSLEGKAKNKLLDRHSRTRIDRASGKPKKGGAGGKFNWGASLEDEANSGVKDPKDPNYDSDEDKDGHVCLQSTEREHSKNFKDAITSLIQEYFLSGNVQEVKTSLKKMGFADTEQYFVKKLVMMAFDQNDHGREMASSLLSALYSEVIAPEEMESGFLAVVESVEDLKLDVPGVADVLAGFIARAITDDILPPIFVNHLKAGGQGEEELVHKTELLLNSPHSAERILRLWGGEGNHSWPNVQDSIRKLLQEFVASGDAGEAAACLRRLGLPLVHHELVKQALQAALEASPGSAARGPPPTLILLEALAAGGHISEDQLLKGFVRVSNSIDDFALDCPDARERFHEFCEEAGQRSWLPAQELQEAVTKPRTLSGFSDHSLQKFKKQAADTVREYYLSGDAAEVAACFRELDQPGFHSLLVKQAVQLALDAKDREMEMTAKLIRELCPETLSSDQVALGFTRLLACAEDLTLDCPAAPRELAQMLGRLIVDEVLPPAFLAAVLSSLNNQSLGVSIVQATGKMLSARHAAERLQICWHAGTRSVEGLRAEIEDLVKEYLETEDVKEAAFCWRQLDVAFYGHQLVVAILVAAFDSPAKTPQLMQLLQHFAGTGEVSQTQIQKGYMRIEKQLDDLALDFPASPKQFETCKETARQAGWIENAPFSTVA